MDFQKLSTIEFLPGLGKLDLGAKAQVIQSLLQENFFHSSGLCYSLLLITGPNQLRPIAKGDMDGSSNHALEMGKKGGCYEDGGATQKAAADEGMTFENSIWTAGLYLQAQTARYLVTQEPEAYQEALKAMGSLRLVYDYSKAKGLAGWMGKP